MPDPLYVAARAKWGDAAQMDKAIEEYSEATLALIRWRQGRTKREDVIEELADARIMNEQMSAIFGEREVGEAYIAKRARLARMLARD